ncbi:chaplin [Streptomyces sp. DSM 44917]|uniref:Chaplin n=1 Tax=Streptomyces boetiae TaxID=3075541 RepID=A0ABU2LFT4_9ACTN|nr:chaplin [Streptomyces sp. DSM 44917]MDT0310102.1 chaplin [Streptomyces sp. DSM 44917]
MNTAKKAAVVLAAAGAVVGTAAGAASAAGDGAAGKAVKSPGLISGNVIQVPVKVPIQLVGNSINVVGILNPAFGNTGAAS